MEMLLNPLNPTSLQTIMSQEMLLDPTSLQTIMSQMPESGYIFIKFKSLNGYNLGISVETDSGYDGNPNVGCPLFQVYFAKFSNDFCLKNFACKKILLIDMKGWTGVLDFTSETYQEISFGGNIIKARLSDKDVIIEKDSTLSVLGCHDYIINPESIYFKWLTDLNIQK